MKVSCVVEASTGSKALQATQHAFEFERDLISLTPLANGEGELEVRGVALDRDQAQMRVRHVPDKPGTAGALCNALANADISLNDIVQSEQQHVDDSRDISFTLKREDRAAADRAVSNLLPQWPGAPLEDGPAIARVCQLAEHAPRGAGRCRHAHTHGADAGVNIEMTATSEIRTSCVVAQSDGIAALQAVHAGFQLGSSTRLQVQGTESPT